MSFYGGLSMLAIVLLFLLVFRSLKPLLLAVLVLSVAVSCGLAALLFFFPQPHILSLVFATTLIGIAIDYSFHGMLAANHARSTFSAMLPSLALGLLTTLLGYLALLWLPFSLLQQVAVFMLAGLVAAFVSVWLLLPLLLATTPYVRAGGLGQALVDHLPRGQLPWVLGAHLLGMLLFGWAGLLALATALLLFVWLRRALLLRLGGTTGDTAGALVELAECAVLLALALSL